MKYIKLLSMMLLAMIAFASCSDDELDQTSISGTDTSAQSDFEKWLQANYTDPYNIKVYYRYNDKETDNTYNLVPADTVKAKALAIAIKHVWLEAYDEVAGQDFLKAYTPRVFQFLGSPEYNTTGSLVLGTAEGGVKVTLFNVNALDPDNPYIDQDSPFAEYSSEVMDMNYWFFHTMHHEFCHILTQTKDYSPDFRTVSAAKYQSSNWVNIYDEKAPAMGFVTGYASGEYNEDFAELYSTYITKTAEAWQKILDAGVVTNADGTTDTSGRDAILTKLNIMKAYFKNSWNIDMDKLREVVLRRSKEISTLDLKTLK